MKRTMLVFSVLFMTFSIACTDNKENADSQETAVLSETEAIDSTLTMISGPYGAEMSNAEVIAVNNIDAFVTSDSMKLKLRGEIVESCPKKGCWMKVKLNSQDTIRVTFKDYGFFVPVTDLKGQTVIMEGLAFRKTTDVATLKHYAEDAGKSEKEIEKITEAKEEISFEATGVEIK